MAKEICISSTPHETRLAILEDDQLAEIYYERENEYTLAGSIYNGRVTRVLPGMQSAFVDLGLERDAFLYVTDFLELEDSEESDELEKAATSGGAQAPREIRRGGNGERQDSKKSESRNSQDRNQDRGNRGRDRAASESGTDATAEAVEASPVSEDSESGAQDSSEQGGARRWRGRRRRRSGRGGSEESQETQAAPTSSGEEDNEAHEDHSLHASAEASSAPAAAQAAPAFTLPGESLSKYGGVPAETAAPKAAPQAAKPASNFKPATLIESPLSWDGSGLLPGESLSRHRNRTAETEQAATVDAEPQGVFADAASATHEAHHEAEVSESAEAASPDEVEQHEFAAELAPESVEHHAKPSEIAAVEREGAVEAAEHAADVAQHEAEPAHADHSTEFTSDVESPVSDEDDASASHNIDPTPHSGFRLFGLGKKKGGDTPATPQAKADHEPTPETSAKPATVLAVSAYAPGAGVIEEELIDGEEFDAPRKHSKSDEHDFDVYEEETLPSQLRTGDLGEMLQEAHLDHKIQLKFEDKGEEEEIFDEDDEEEDDEEASAEGQAAPQEGAPQRRDRNQRGRRGRGQHGGGQQNGRRGMTRRSAQTSDLPIISDLLKPGQEILVQIAKEPIAKKGARITSHIALPGRFLVFMPTVSHIGVSRKIASDEERQRLKRVLLHERGESSGGFIVRTAAEGASEEELRADLRFLIHLWEEIKSRSEASKSPALIYHDLSLIERILRDQVSANFSSIWVDSQDDYERIVRFLNRFSPSLVRRVKLYTKEVPLFEHFGIQDEISKALRSKVWLKSGGSIVINQTEALVAIDINTGKYVGKSARLEDTIVKTNLDAVPEIVRQIRLRDLGGIIVIDFIDMDERKNRFKVLAALEEALKADRAPTKVLQFNDFGLVAITRKRVKQSLERTLSIPCPTCQATGMVKSPATVCNEIFIELRKMKRHFEGADVLLRVNPETVKVLKQNNAAWLNEFEELVGKNILVKSDATLHPEQFDIQG